MNESDVWFYLRLTRTLILTDALEAYSLIELTGDLQHQTLPNVFGGLNAHDLTGVTGAPGAGVTGAGVTSMTGASVTSMTGVGMTRSR